MAASEVVVIVPSEDELEVKGDVMCPFDGCNCVFKSTASRNMHITRHHEGKNLKPVTNDNSALRTSIKLYYCPVDGCTRSQGSSNKPFKKLGQVKQHYNMIHKEKQYSCEKCGKMFGMKDACSRHMKECGVIFTCQSCDLELKSYNALYQHCKRSGHVFKNRKKSSSSLSGSKPCIIVAPLIIKAVVPIASNTTSLGGGIEKGCGQLSGNGISSNDEDTSNSVELATQTELTGYEFLTSNSPQTDKSLTNANPLCEFGTQTMPLLSDSWPHPLINTPTRGDIPDLFDTETIDFGTQTLHSSVFNPYSTHEDLAIQTYNYTKEQGSQT